MCDVIIPNYIYHFPTFEILYSLQIPENITINFNINQSFILMKNNPMLVTHIIF